MAGIADADKGAAPGGDELLGARDGGVGIGAAGDDDSRVRRNRRLGTGNSAIRPSSCSRTFISDQFEHVMVLTSISIGLAITNALLAVSRASEPFTEADRPVKLSWAGRSGAATPSSR